MTASGRLVEGGATRTQTRKRGAGVYLEFDFPKDAVSERFGFFERFFRR